MQPPNQHPHDAGALQPSRPRGLLAIVLAAGLCVALAIGVLIGRATSTATAVTSPSSVVLGQLRVSSKPADGNVVVDGRFIGVAPIDRVDLDPGKHSVVIDAFGYQPYSGTLVIAQRGTLNLEVTLAPLGVEAPTIGSVTGVGTARHAVVPPSALLPAGRPPAPDPNRKPVAPRSSTTPPSPPRTAPRPRRDCSGEKSSCHESCRHAETDCRFSCQGCTSCLTSVGWDECHRQCDTCRTGCDQNTKFCATSCDSQYSNCEASQQ